MAQRNSQNSSNGNDGSERGSDGTWHVLGSSHQTTLTPSDNRTEYNPPVPDIYLEMLDNHGGGASFASPMTEEGQRAFMQDTLQNNLRSALQQEAPQPPQQAPQQAQPPPQPPEVSRHDMRDHFEWKKCRCCGAVSIVCGIIVATVIIVAIYAGGAEIGIFVSKPPDDNQNRATDAPTRKIIRPPSQSSSPPTDSLPSKPPIRQSTGTPTGENTRPPSQSSSSPTDSLPSKSPIRQSTGAPTGEDTRTPSQSSSSPTDSSPSKSPTHSPVDLSTSPPVATPQASSSANPTPAPQARNSPNPTSIPPPVGFPTSASGTPSTFSFVYGDDIILAKSSDLQSEVGCVEYCQDHDGAVYQLYLQGINCFCYDNIECAISWGNQIAGSYALFGQYYTKRTLTECGFDWCDAYPNDYLCFTNQKQSLRSYSLHGDNIVLVKSGNRHQETDCLKYCQNYDGVVHETISTQDINCYCYDNIECVMPWGSSVRASAVTFGTVFSKNVLPICPSDWCDVYPDDYLCFTNQKQSLRSYYLHGDNIVLVKSGNRQQETNCLKYCQNHDGVVHETIFTQDIINCYCYDNVACLIPWGNRADTSFVNSGSAFSKSTLQGCGFEWCDAYPTSSMCR